MKTKEACEVLVYQTSMQIRKEKADLIVPTRWVRTNKHDGLVRLVAQGFKTQDVGSIPAGCTNGQCNSREYLLNSLRALQFCSFGQGHQERLFQWQVGRQRDLLGSTEGRFTRCEARATFASKESNIRFCRSSQVVLVGIERPFAFRRLAGEQIRTSIVLFTQ